jgi:integrase
MRAGEATALEIRTIDGTNLQLRIIGKGNKERIVPLPLVQNFKMSAIDSQRVDESGAAPSCAPNTRAVCSTAPCLRRQLVAGRVRKSDLSLCSILGADRQYLVRGSIPVPMPAGPRGGDAQRQKKA